MMTDFASPRTDMQSMIGVARASRKNAGPGLSIISVTPRFVGRRPTIFANRKRSGRSKVILAGCNLIPFRMPRLISWE